MAHDEAWIPSDPWSPFVYRARPERVVDGDTIVCSIDLGFNIQHTDSVRLRTVDTAETWFRSKDSEEYLAGVEHTEYTTEWVENAVQYAVNLGDSRAEWPLILKTEFNATGKYGRIIADVFSWEPGTPDLGTELLDEFPESVEHWE